MICPTCKGRKIKITEISNLHCLWQCQGCGYSGDGDEFDFNLQFPRIKAGDRVKITTRKVTRIGTVLYVENPHEYQADPLYNIELMDDAAGYWYWKQYYDGGKVEVLSAA